jgi:hypothetical protein
MTLMAIDPGKNTGFAVFRNSVLFGCGLLKFSNTREYTKFLFRLMDEVRPDQAIIEIPRVYPFKHQKGDQNDLIGLAVQAGICIAAASPFCQVQEVHPQEWKGQRPKKVDNEHTLKMLYSPIETDIFFGSGIKKSERHNVLDAIGIGLWRLGRR